MAHIKITKGLDIPLVGEPEGEIKPLVSGGETSPLIVSQVALDLNPFEGVKFRLLAKEGDRVKLGQPLAEDKDFPNRFFVAPAGGIIREIRRGMKRRLLDIVIEVDRQEEVEKQPPVILSQISREDLVERLKVGGLFTHIRQRPFNVLADTNQVPRSIFVKGLESAPGVPPSRMQVAGHEKEFQAGLDTLAKLTSGSVHLVYDKDSHLRSFVEAKNVKKHTAEGPHPIANQSLHIQYIDPIISPEDVIWTVNAHDVVRIGYFVLHGRYFVDRIISIAGPGIIEGATGYFRVREGFPISALLGGRIKKGLVRLISGDLLTGKKVDPEDFLGFYDYSFCAVPENISRQFLHFLRLGSDKYTFSGAYLSGHFDHLHKDYNFTTNQHGEHRPFIDPTLYDEVMPLNVPTMHLVKAVMAEDYDLAAELGLVQVDSEDFALPTFVCPSKMEMVGIIKQGLRRYMADILK